MAGPEDPFTPGPTQDPTAGIPNLDTFENIRQQWATFLDQPGARTALLQTGISLLQPPRFGDTPVSQIGRAVGEAGEAVTRGEAAQTKQALQSAQAEAAGARAGQAESRLGLEYFRQQSMNQRAQDARLVQAHRDYANEIKSRQGNYLKEIQLWQQENSLLPAAKQKPRPEPPQYPSFDEWARSRGLPINVGGRPSGPVPGQTVVGGYRYKVGATNPNDPKNWEPVERSEEGTE